MTHNLEGRSGGAFLVEDRQPASVFTPEDFTPEDLLIAKTASDFLRGEVLPHVERIEQGDHALMADLMRKAGELGLLAADVPEVYGGLGARHTTSALIAEQLNWQQSFALTHEAHTVIGTLPLLYFGNDDQKRRYLPKLASGEWIASFALSESSSGSDALAAQTRATLSPDGKQYLLTGEKMWITNTAFAQLFTVFAKVDGQKDKFTAFLVERDSPGLSFGKEEHKLGMHGTSTRRLILEGVPVPVENAMEVGKGHYAAFCALNMGRFKLEAGAVGGLKETLAVCAAYAKQRKAFGHAIAEYGLIKQKLAGMAADIFALESMVYRLAGDLDTAFEGIVSDAPDASSNYHRAAEEYAIECNIIKVIGSEAYSRWTDEAIQIHGGYGYTEEFPVARAWRDQRLLRIGEGANEIVRLAIVNLILRREKAGRLPLFAKTNQVISAAADSGPTVPLITDDALTFLQTAAADMKQAARFMLTFGHEALGTELAEAQEVVAAIADAVCSAYALESIWIRCARLQSAQSPRAQTALLAAQVAARRLIEVGFGAMVYVAEALTLRDGAAPSSQSSEPKPSDGRFIQGRGMGVGSPMLTARALAEAVLKREGYPV